MEDINKRPEELMIRALIHNLQHGGPSVETLAQIEDALDRDKTSESVVHEFPDIWKTLTDRREVCNAEGVDIRRVHTIFMMHHIDKELAALFKLDSCGNITCTVPHGEGFDLANGNVALSNFGTLYKMILSIYNRWRGHYDNQNKDGRLCELVIGVVSPYGEKVLSRWIYGSRSTQPPDEIMQFVEQCELVAKSIPIGNAP